jgi:Na+-translocating ferredoxin:NAD+ oxidoreductase RnfG subunit
MKNLSSIALLLSPAFCLQAHAEIYMTDVQAAALLFPQEQLSRKQVELSQHESDAIEQSSGEKVRAKQLSLFESNVKGNFVFIDQVLGKHEFITYAVGIRDGKVAGIEIIEYRESYGQKVRDKEWRDQFAGKDKLSKLKLNDDIKNISGATLSSAHVTAGVKRILHTYDKIRARI